jgi:hypothetical protein
MPSSFDKNKMEQALRKAVEPALKERAREMERLLDELRRKHQGQDVAKVKPALRSAFQRKGWTITEPELTRFSKAVSEGTKIHVNADAFG